MRIGKEIACPCWYTSSTFYCRCLDGCYTSAIFVVPLG